MAHRCRLSMLHCSRRACPISLISTCVQLDVFSKSASNIFHAMQPSKLKINLAPTPKVLPPEDDLIFGKVSTSSYVLVERECSTSAGHLSIFDREM